MMNQIREFLLHANTISRAAEERIEITLHARIQVLAQPSVWVEFLGLRKHVAIHVHGV